MGNSTGSGKARIFERQCAGLHREPDLIGAFQHDVAAAGLVGEADAAAIVYLTDISALLPKPVALKIGGSSSAGKSFIARMAHDFLPPSAIVTITSMSKLAIAYRDEPIVNRTVFLIESKPLGDDDAAYLIRSLISEGFIAHETVQPGKGGKMEGIRIEQHGPCAFVTTSTLPSLDYDLETRLLGISVDESREQTRRILEDQVARVNSAAPTSIGVRPWHALYHYLRLGPRTVEVPYGRAIVDAIPDDAMAVRMRRSGALILSFISASALLHRGTRASNPGDGRIIANRADYEQVYKLLAAPLAEGLEHAVPAGVREVVEAVKDYHRRHKNRAPNQAQIAHALDRDTGTVSRQIKLAIHHQWLRDELADQTRNSRLVPGDPLPDEGQVLPDPDAVFDRTPGEIKREMTERPARPARPRLARPQSTAGRRSPAFAASDRPVIRARKSI